LDTRGTDHFKLLLTNVTLSCIILLCTENLNINFSLFLTLMLRMLASSNVYSGNKRSKEIKLLYANKMFTYLSIAVTLTIESCYFYHRFQSQTAKLYCSITLACSRLNTIRVLHIIEHLFCSWIQHQLVVTLSPWHKINYKILTTNFCSALNVCIIV